MPFDPKRKGDIKIVFGATLAVLLVGLFIFGALMMTRGGDGIECGQLNMGLATGVRATLEDGPYPQTGGGKCSFWLALDNGDIVAYKAIQPQGCTVTWKLDHWECGGNEIEASALAQYPASIKTVGGVDALILNLGTPEPSTTTG